jgi:hypothetical protein
LLTVIKGFKVASLFDNFNVAPVSGVLSLASCKITETDCAFVFAKIITPKRKEISILYIRKVK